MLYVESQQTRRMAYCVNVHGGQLLLYFDTQRLLKEIEFGIHQKWWKKSTALSVPQTNETADLFLLGVKSYHGKWKHSHIFRKPDGLTIKDYFEDELPITTATNPESSVVQIGIGSPEQTSRWISLSDDCWAQISNNHLKGFFIKGIVASYDFQRT
jgi:hypothetical protein